MNLNEAKTLIELLLPSVKEIVQAATDNVSRAVADALAESEKRTEEKIAQLTARVAALEKNREQ
jgi:polyhydroxyalkanoate synthesis regulator phasin